jgi:lipoprotein-anchoring transpeptidase ErfK/SrfK
MSPYWHARRPDRRPGILSSAVLASLTVGAGVWLAAPAAAATPAETAALTAPAVAGTPCTAAAKACVDLTNQHAWLIKDGKVLRGPVPIATGGPGQETPVGDVFRVYRKEKDYKSTESRLADGAPAPMPYSVFFADGGIAFHAGSPERASAGCVHLDDADAQAWFNYLQVGDHVQVRNGPVAHDGEGDGDER